MAVVDHLVYAVSDLALGVDRFESETGIRPEFGGAHPGRGTHNALVSFGGSYLELIAPDPDQPAPAEPRPFGLDDPRICARSGPGPDRAQIGGDAVDLEHGLRGRLVNFAARPDPLTDETIESLAERMREVGHDPGDIVAMSRTAPTGEELRWRLTLPTMAYDGFAPFLIDWGDAAHPSIGAPGGVRLSDLMGSTPRHREANRLLDALGLEEMAVGGPGGLSAIVTIPDSGRRPLVL